LPGQLKKYWDRYKSHTQGLSRQLSEPGARLIEREAGTGRIEDPSFFPVLVQGATPGLSSFYFSLLFNILLKKIDFCL